MSILLQKYSSHIGFIGSKMMLRAFFSRRITDFGAGKHNHIVSARINGLAVVRRFWLTPGG
jgi:hypothetical protein